MVEDLNTKSEKIWDAHGWGSKYKKWENMKYFENPIFVSNSIICYFFFL